ncbi:acetoacetate--CoA ligase [Nocardioides sp. TRM66260-LWL]|uniref:acetoacetate--CoA ligase n=1 Tax=Nocardioides sp. TRM66260-LWL TaxID=2874478 RepID=UPI001CC54E0B|nr:acetoacetate--CoA ligase [Nocardioides sp. TRM66260-LWL]MBZ5735841.1 acetoacetate--CoA ligase [Nocardioides sp. TRM66260-LWL]
MSTPEALWTPPRDGRSRLERMAVRLHDAGVITAEERDDYASLHAWSVREPEVFWRETWHELGLPHTGSTTPALASASMPGATWFPDVRLNYAEAMLALPGRADDDVVVVAASQSRAEVSLTAAALRDQVARARAGLVRLGVGRGDRVAAYAPNVPETLVLLLAAASLGAVFSSCAPEFGTQSVVDRWQQIEPTVLLAVDGYRYGVGERAKDVHRGAEVEALRAALPSLTATVHLPYLDPSAPAPAGTITWEALVAEPGPLEFEPVPFDHPLYVLFSSGTTGLPKPIVHGHGGIALEHGKALALHHDLGPEDRFLWFSTTGWMMWNLLVSGLLVGATVVLVDGDPASPDLGALWRLVAEHRVTVFGTSAPFLMACRKDGLVPRELADLGALRQVGSTGAPLPAEGFDWVHEAVGPVQLASVSGGTDVCSAFVGAAPTVPVWRGEISCRMLGCAVEALDEQHRPVRDSLGELVITAPLPSMPLGLWGDDDGSRYRAAYFDDIPGVWRHGDWITITERGSCRITGRSDATLNRGGVRLGTAEFYAVVEALPEVRDSLVVHLEDDEGGAGRLVLLVVLEPGRALDDDLRRAIAVALRTHLSPRHVPDDVLAVGALPRTLSGKRLEVPVKRILRGADPEEVAAAGALQAPESLVEIAALRDAHLRG